MRKIKIITTEVEIEAELNESDTAQAIWEKLPIEGEVKTWGDEIYFEIPIEKELENGLEVVKEGDIAYWPEGHCFCIFFGKTPISTETEIKPASAVTLIGRLLDDPKKFKKVADGQRIIIVMARVIELPKPKTKSEVSLEETLNKRRSIREYKPGSLSLDQVSQLLWAASGENQYGRTSPSAGATYPLETYLIVGDVEGLEPGIYHYFPTGHSLERIKKEDIRSKLSRAALGQAMIEKAPIDIVITANYNRTTGYYGQRGIRYVHMEAGHVGQNLHLQAVALNLGTVMIGAFQDWAVKEVLEINEDPLYIIPVGKI